MVRRPRRSTLGKVAGGAVAKRLVPLAVGAIIVIGLVVWLVAK